MGSGSRATGETGSSAIWTGMGAISSLRLKQRHSEGPAGRMHRSADYRIVTLLLLGLFGCGRHSGAAAATPAAEILLVVQNHHWSDVVVSALHDGVVDRIGLATAVKTSTFIIPSRRLGPSGLVRLRGHAVGATDTHTSESFLVQPGQEVTWTLESDLARSSIAVH
jgi:hypothetical protein